ncbi:MAG: DUF4864 domain-containing protein [Burkholderiales bacterium]|nr:DUF4864 domain-containing protein [Burkholderiales bacterium]
MRHRMLVILRLATLLIASISISAWSAELTSSEVTAIQKTVRQQIDALANDDALGAFALTSTDTRTRIGTPDDFLRLIKEEYDPVYRHRLALYSPPQIVNGKTYQLVRLTDLDSRVWIAIYLLDRDEVGDWKIEGCQLVETTTVAV